MVYGGFERAGGTLSDAMKSTTRSFMICVFSIGIRRAKLVKIDPVVGLYTSCISSRRRATTFSGSGKWMERVTDSYHVSLMLGYTGRFTNHKLPIADCVEVSRSSAESVVYVGRLHSWLSVYIQDSMSKKLSVARKHCEVGALAALVNPGNVNYQT